MWACEFMGRVLHIILIYRTIIPFLQNLFINLEEFIKHYTYLQPFSCINKLFQVRM